MEVYAMEGPAPHIPLQLVIKAIKLMKYGKAAGTCLVLAEMLKASGVEGGQQIRDLIRSSDNDSTGFWPPGSLHTLGADGHI